MVSGRGDSGGVEPPPRRSLVADDLEFQAMKAMLLSVSDAVKTLVESDRAGTDPVPSSTTERETTASRDSSSASGESSQGESVTNFIDESDEGSDAGSERRLDLEEASGPLRWYMPRNDWRPVWEGTWVVGFKVGNT